MTNLAFYTADSSYCEYLRKIDSRVPYVTDNKANRPFVGVLLLINDVKYYAPLTSPKPKHLSMKNRLDFLKIKSGAWGAINLNNMIPIDYPYITKLNVSVNLTGTKEEADYSNLLTNQLSWCNSYKAQIIARAQKLYMAVTQNKIDHRLLLRCCDYKKLEVQALNYKI